MNEQLQQALTVILNKTMQGVDAGVSFLSSEIPEVIHQLLVWKLASSSIFMVLGMGLLLSAYRLIRLAMKNHAQESKKDWFHEKESRYVIPSILGVVSVFIGSCMTIVNGSTSLQIWLAPKIYLIEYAASLAK